jgi:hypothetical protein
LRCFISAATRASGMVTGPWRQGGLEENSEARNVRRQPVWGIINRSNRKKKKIWIPNLGYPPPPPGSGLGSRILEAWSIKVRGVLVDYGKETQRTWHYTGHVMTRILFGPCPALTLIACSASNEPAHQLYASFSSIVFISCFRGFELTFVGFPHDFSCFTFCSHFEILFWFENCTQIRFFYLKFSNFVLIQKMFWFEISTNSNLYSLDFELVVKPLFNYIIWFPILPLTYNIGSILDRSIYSFNHTFLY